MENKDIVDITNIILPFLHWQAQDLVQNSTGNTVYEYFDEEDNQRKSMLSTYMQAFVPITLQESLVRDQNQMFRHNVENFARIINDETLSGNIERGCFMRPFTYTVPMREGRLGKNVIFCFYPFTKKDHLHLMDSNPLYVGEGEPTTYRLNSKKRKRS